MRSNFYLFLLMILVLLNSCSKQKVKVNDLKFEKALIKLNLDEEEDGFIVVNEEVETRTKLNLSGGDIESLTGLEAFQNLTYLDCSNNELRNLDLSGNQKLRIIDCDSNFIESLDLSKNQALTKVWCDGNKIKFIELNGCKSLKYLSCSDNQLETLKIESLDSLEDLRCWNNQISELNLLNNSRLQVLACWNNRLNKLDISKNLSLVTLACEENRLTDLDITYDHSKLKRLRCANNPIYDLGVLGEELPGAGLKIKKEEEVKGKPGAEEEEEKGRPTLLPTNETETREKPTPMVMYLEELNCSWTNLNDLNLRKCLELQELDCRGNKITFLDLGGNKSLKNLNCDYNLLFELNLSFNDEIQNISCYDNRLQELILGDPFKLNKLDCRKNQLTELDIFSSTNLRSLRCDSQVRDYAAMHEFVAVNSLRSVVESKSTNSTESIDELKTELESLSTSIFWIIGLIAFLIIAKIIKTITS